MTRAQQWRAKAKAAEKVEQLALPSGVVILARRPGPLQLAAWEKLPFQLTAVAQGEAGAGEISMEKALAAAEFLRELLMYCCVEPRVSLTPAGDEEIHPRDIPEEDWTFIVQWALRVKEAAALSGFRGGRSDDGDRGDGEGVRSETF